MTNYRLTHARHDRAHCLAPGLFRSIARGQKRQNLDILYEYSETESIHFAGYQALSVDDLRFLQGLIALAGPNGILLEPEPDTTVGRQLRLFLDPRLDAAKNDALVVRVTFRRLLKEIGLGIGGKNLKLLKASLKRLSNVSVYVHKGTREASFQLLSYVYDDADEKLHVALNPRVTEAIMGFSPYVYIDLAEVRKLKSDPIRLIHQRLCAWINPGQFARISLETLCEYVWHDEQDVSPSTIRGRKRKIRNSLPEFEEIGWKIKEYVKDKWEISRPKVPVYELTEKRKVL